MSVRVTAVDITPEYRFGTTGVELSHTVIRFSTTGHTEMPLPQTPTTVTLPVIGPIAAVCVAASPQFFGAKGWDGEWVAEWVAVGLPQLRCHADHAAADDVQGATA